MPTGDSWCAINLPRPDDLELLPAWLGIDASDGAVPWPAIEQVVRERTTASVVDAAQELGLAVSALGGHAIDEQLRSRGTTSASRPWLARRVGDRSDRRSIEDGVVVDLSSLWAGPSCARLLGRGGMRIIKVESTGRPDGSRFGDRRFHRWLHEGHELVEMDFASVEGRAELVALLRSADVVIEGSRPRALERLGIDPSAFVALRPGRVWVSITGYGRCGPWRDRVAFGDDAAVAGGLVGRDGSGAPTFVGDAIADPLTGLVAALLVTAAMRRGGGSHIDVCLREVARSAAAGATVVW